MSAESKQRSEIGGWLLAALLLGAAVIASVAAVAIVTDAFDGVMAYAQPTEPTQPPAPGAFEAHHPDTDTDADGGPDGDDGDGDGDDAADDSDENAEPTTFAARIPGTWFTRSTHPATDATSVWQPLGKTPGELTIPAGHEARFDAALTFDDTDALALADLPAVPLVELRIQGCARLSNIVLPDDDAPGFVNLRTLLISDLPALATFEIDHPAIEHLALKRCTLDLDDAIVLSGYDYVDSLRTLELEAIEQLWFLDISGLEALESLTVAQMPNLVEVILGKMDLLTHAAIDAPTLSYIYLYDCPALHDLRVAYSRDLAQLEIDDCASLPAGWLTSTFLWAVDLEYVAISGDVPLDSQDLGDFLRTVRLRTLELIRARVPDFAGVAMPWLRELQIDGFYNPDDPDGFIDLDDPDLPPPANLVRMQIADAPQLRDLEVRHAPIASLSLRGLLWLEELELHSHTVRLLELRNMPELWELYLECPVCETLSLEHVRASYIDGLEGVRRITVVGGSADEINLYGVPKLERLTIVDAPALERLYLGEVGACEIMLHGTPALYGVSLEYIASEALPRLPRALRTLVIIDCPELVDLSQLREITGLQYLQIEACDALGTDALAVLADHPSLRHIECYDTDLDDASMRAIASLAMLELLDAEVGAVAPETLALLSGHLRLKQLMLMGDFTALALDNMPRLQELQLDAAAMQSLVIRNAPNLRLVSLYHCGELESLDGLNGLSLTEIDLNGAIGVSEESTDRFEAANPTCTVRR